VPIDDKRPHVGRIYDYVLGGTDNYEVDRVAAQQIIAKMPAYPRWARLNRAFLGYVGRRWASESRARVLDLGSGLPKQGHLNSWLLNARILFVDNDPLAVVEGRQLLASTPDMGYVEGDIRDAAKMLAQVESFFGTERPVAVGCIGVGYFLSDDQFRNLMQQLHGFCAPGTSMAISFPAVTGGSDPEETVRTLVEIARLAGINLYHRTAEQIGELVKPWHMITTGPLEAWLDVDVPAISGTDPLRHVTMMGAFANHE